MSKHFSDDELRCKCGCGRLFMIPEFVAKLERVRLAFGKPLIISSGYRCPDHNFEVGGSEFSAHTAGCAVDVTVRGADALKLVDVAIYCGITGLGISQRGHSRFIHLDDAPAAEGQPRPTVWSY